jgi:hypothetical protein
MQEGAQDATHMRIVVDDEETQLAEIYADHDAIRSREATASSCGAVFRSLGIESALLFILSTSFRGKWKVGPRPSRQAGPPENPPASRLWIRR